MTFFKQVSDSDVWEDAPVLLWNSFFVLCEKKLFSSAETVS